MLRSVARQALLIVGIVFVAGVVAQVVLAGLGVFSDPRSFITHREFGYLLGMVTLVLLILALVGRAPRRVIGLCALLLVLFALQSVFIALRASAPDVAALHPLNGFLILLVAITVTRAAWSLRGDEVAAPASATLTPSAESR
jgi:heme A synthase